MRGCALLPSWILLSLYNAIVPAVRYRDTVDSRLLPRSSPSRRWSISAVRNRGRSSGCSPLPSIADRFRGGDEIFFLDAVLDTFDDAFDGRNMVRFVFVVPPAHEPPAVVFILEAFDDAVVTALAALHHGVPFFGVGVHGAVGDVFVAVLADGEVEGGLGAVIGVGKGLTAGFVVGVGIYERELEGEEEVDAVFLGLFPL